MFRALGGGVKLFRRRSVESTGYPVRFDHPIQLLAATFLRAVSEGHLDLLWERLSQESRGLLEGAYAARAGVALAHVAGVGEESGDARLDEVVTPAQASVLGVVGGERQVNAMGVSAARLVSPRQAFVLLLPEFGDERIVSEEDWRPSHLLGFVYENRDWKVDLGLTAALSAEAGLPDPLGRAR